MEIKKSREYTQEDGSKVSFTFDRSDGKIVNIKKDGVSVNPSSEDFTNFSTSEDARAAYNVAKYGNAKKSYLNKNKFAERRGDNVKTSEELTDYYDTEVKKDLNQQKINAEQNAKEELAIQNATIKETGVGSSSDIFSYPLNFDTTQDHIKIMRHKYVRPGINQSKAANTQSSKLEATKKSTASNARKNHTVYKRATYNSVGDGVAGELIGSILLPMPKVADVNGVEWGKSELTISGLAGLGAIAPLARFTGKDEEASREALEKLKGSQGGALEGTNVAGSSATEFRRALTAQTLSGLAGALTGSNLDADTFLARTSGRVLNPNAEVLFQGPVIRDFAFSFIMIARSQKEGDEIRRIIRFLKLGMAPKFRSTTFLENPDVFKLEYKNGTGTDDILKTVNRFNPGGLALQTMSVDYSPNGYWSAYRDSQPVQLKMDLSFTELRPIYESDQQDTPANSVGY